MLGLTFEPGTDVRMSTCHSAFPLKGMNGHIYGVCNERTDVKKINNKVKPMMSPFSLKIATNANMINRMILLATLNS